MDVRTTDVHPFFLQTLFFFKPFFLQTTHRSLITGNFSHRQSMRQSMRRTMSKNAMTSWSDRLAQKFGAVVATLSAGDAFGEIAVQTGETRTASIVAADAVGLLILQKDDYDEVIRQ